jgi:hypothetical protein
MYKQKKSTNIKYVLKHIGGFKVVETEKRFNDLLEYFNWSETDWYVQLPNEIFKDLTDSCIKSFRHRAFAYSFYYLSAYLYRNAKYGSVHLSQLYSLELIELMFGNRKPINYITKRKGVLDQIGYTASENDFPLSSVEEDGVLVGFHMFHDLPQYEKDLMKVPRNFICKRPVKAFKRFPSDSYYTGTFFEFENTHRIDFTIFARCMCLENGFMYFYVYSFLYAFKDFINSKPKVYKSYIALSLNVSPRTLNAILDRLQKMKLLKINEGIGFSYRMKRKINVKR